MKKYTNKILVVAGVLFFSFSVIFGILIFKKLEKQGKITTKSSSEIKTATITVDENGEDKTTE